MSRGTIPAETMESRVIYARNQATQNGVDPTVFERQIRQESGFNPEAYNAGSDASGIAQIVPRFHPAVDPWNWKAALQYSAGWMGRMVKAYGNHREALIAYNWGPGNLASWKKRGAVATQLPQETQRYLTAALGAGWPEPGGSVANGLKLSRVLERARSQCKQPPLPYVWGGKAPPNFDCSGLVAWCYEGNVRSYTDHIFSDTERVDGADIAPGDIVLYLYEDEQDARFPHVGIYLSDTRIIDARFGLGVGEHDHLARSFAQRFYRRLPGVVVDTIPGTTPVPTPERPPGSDTIDPKLAGFINAVAYLGDNIGDELDELAKRLLKQADTALPKKVTKRQLEERLADHENIMEIVGARLLNRATELRRVRAEQVGPRPN